MGANAIALLDIPTTLGKIGGYEADAIDYTIEAGCYCATGVDGTPSNYAVLAVGESSAEEMDYLVSKNTAPGTATMGYFVNNGTVFNVGCIGWVSAIEKNLYVRQISCNVINKLQHRGLWSNFGDIGEANGITAFTAYDNYLFCANQFDGQNCFWSRSPSLIEIHWKNIGIAGHVLAMGAHRRTMLVFKVHNGEQQLWAGKIAHNQITNLNLAASPRSTNEAVVGRVKTMVVSPNGFMYLITQAGEETRLYKAKTPVLYDADADALLESVDFKCVRLNDNWLGSDFGLSDVHLMTLYHDYFYVVLKNGKLLRSKAEFSIESAAYGWEYIDADCTGATGFAIIKNLIYMAKSNNRLYFASLYPR